MTQSGYLWQAEGRLGPLWAVAGGKGCPLAFIAKGHRKQPRDSTSRESEHQPGAGSSGISVRQNEALSSSSGCSSPGPWGESPTFLPSCPHP